MPFVHARRLRPFIPRALTGGEQRAWRSPRSTTTPSLGVSGRSVGWAAAAGWEPRAWAMPGLLLAPHAAEGRCCSLPRNVWAKGGGLEPAFMDRFPALSANERQEAGQLPVVHRRRSEKRSCRTD